MSPHLTIEILKSRSESPDIFRTDSESKSHASYIGEIEVRPKEQPRMQIGSFEKDQLPKKLLLVISPSSEIDSITAQITDMKVDRNFELFLYVANYGNKVVSVEIWKL